MTTINVWPQNDDYPYSAVVLIQVTYPNGLAAFGSGVMVGENDVLTASHLLYSSANGGAATSVTISPGYDNGIAPYGSYAAANGFIIGTPWGWVLDPHTRANTMSELSSSQLR